MPHSRNTSAVASTGVRLNALIESALLEADPNHYGPSTPPAPVTPSGTSTKRASPIGSSATPPDVLVRPATDPMTGLTTVSASEAFESTSLGHAKVSFNIPIPSVGGGPAVASPPAVVSSAQDPASPARRQRTNPPSKLVRASDSNHSLNDSAGSHASLDTITSEREMSTPTPPPPVAGRSQASGGNTPGRGRTGARLAQPPAPTGGGTSKYMHTLNLAPPSGAANSSARTTAASTLLARSRSNSRHRQPSNESTGSMDRGLDSNPNSSTDAIFAGTAPVGVGPNRISQMAPTLADRARLARLELAELQSEASAAMRELEAAEGMRKEAEVARMQSERDVESVQRRIEVALKKRDELEELLEGLRVENDELEQQLGVSGGFLNRYAGYVEGAVDKGKEGARSRTASNGSSGGGGGGGGGGMGAAGV